MRRLTPGEWLPPLAIYGVARLVSAWFLTVAAGAQPDLTNDPRWHVEGIRPAAPSYWEILSNWDGQWFKTIALHGYTGFGTGSGPEQNALAFAPLYPVTVRGVMSWTGLSFEVAGSLVSLACGAGAMVLLYGWLRRSRGQGSATVAVAVLSFFPAAPVLQAAYSDGMALLLLVLVLRALVGGRFIWALAAGAALAFTRPILLPVAAFVVYVQWRRSVDHGEPAITARIVGVAAAFVFVSFGWVVTAGVIGGSPDAYLRTNGAWRRDGQAVGGWFTGVWTAGLPLVAVLMGVILFALLFLRWRRRGGPVPADLLGGWATIYVLYILMTAPPSAGIVRHLMFTLVPLGVAGPMAEGISNRRRWVLLGAVILVEVLLQWLWVRHAFIVEDPDHANIP